MRDKLKIIVIALMLLFSTNIPVFAEDVNGVSESTGTLEEVISNQSESQEQQSSNKNSDFVNGLNEASDVTANTEAANKATSALKGIVTPIIQIIMYAIVVLLSLVTCLDLAYVAIPFTRGFLGGGNQPKQPSQQGMGGGFGGGSFGGGFGDSSFGGGGFGMGQRPAMGGGQQGQKTCFVTTAAINAVANENPFKTYVKSMLIVMIITPVLLVLTATGVLTNLGLYIGQLLVDAIQGLMGMM